ncbi:MAG: discoidin domain-containing protein [Burkholderiales bacterium]|nr:discoidin domain-containing protein [Opitutaceae bacterium]
MPHPVSRPSARNASARLLALSLVAALAASVASARNPWLQPFTPDSIWNTPIGDGAVYEDININGRAYIAGASQANLDVEYQIRPPVNAPVVNFYQASGFRPRSANTNVQLGRIRIPDTLVLADAVAGDQPNNALTLLNPDRRTTWQLNAAARPVAGGNFWAYEREPQDLYGAGTYGAHAGSGLSGLGGSIRKGELVGDGEIRHAIKLLVWAKTYLYYDAATIRGYRWPAYTSDGYAGSATDPNRYQGTNPKLVMGTLLAIPPSATEASLGLTTAWGGKFFRALQNYGAYLVDDTAFDTTLLNVEEGVNEEFTAAYGYSMRNSAAFRNELKKLIEALRIVDNNTPATIGGPGTRRAPLAAPLFPFDPADGNAFNRATIAFGGDLGGAVSKDGDLATFRTSSVNQSAGQRFFSIDLGAVRSFDRITLETGPANTNNFVRNFAMWASPTGYWTDFVNGGSYRVLQARGEGKTHIRFTNPRTARYITLQSAVTANANVPWTLAEVNVHYDNDPAPVVTNLIPNPSFETGLSGWTNWNGATTLQRDSVDGEQAAKVGPATAGGFTRYVTPPAGAATLNFSFWARASGSTAGTVNVVFLNSSYQQLGSAVSVTVAAYNASAWTKFTRSALAVPAGTSLIQVYAYQGAGGSLAVDHLALRAP